MTSSPTPASAPRAGTAGAGARAWATWTAGAGAWTWATGGRRGRGLGDLDRRGRVSGELASPFEHLRDVDCVLGVDSEDRAATVPRASPAARVHPGDPDGPVMARARADPTGERRLTPAGGSDRGPSRSHPPSPAARLEVAVFGRVGQRRP